MRDLVVALSGQPEYRAPIIDGMLGVALMSKKEPTVDSTRRTLLATGAAAAAVAAAERAFGQADSGAAEAGMGYYERGDVRIRYHDVGSGYPLLLIPGGGLNSSIGNFASGRPFNAIEEFKGEYRCITMDLRNSNTGQSSGPLEIDRPWDSHTDDQIGLMDHLGIDEFMVMGFCIGGPYIWNLLERAPNRVTAAVIAQPVGFNARNPGYFYENFMNNWGSEFLERRPDVTAEMVDDFLTAMFRSDNDFVFTVTRDFARNCQTPILVLPDDTSGHPYDIAMESAFLAPNAQLSLYPWKVPEDRIPLALRHIRSFLRAHQPVGA